MRALVVALLLGSTDPQPDFVLPPELQRLLDDGRWVGTPRGFRLIALSNVADGCVGQALARTGTSEAARSCVLAALDRARRLGPARDGLALTHLNLIYGAADRVGVCADEAEHLRISRELARRSLQHPLAHSDSYRGSPQRWPADQSATLASLARYDAAHGTELLKEPLAAWRSVMETKLDAESQLPVSEVTGAERTSALPRGCAQSFISRYLPEADPPLARTWWTSYRRSFLVEHGPVVGFREWPPGVTRPGDADSGPIVMGIGTAASALGIAAARAQGDLLLAARLDAAAALALEAGAGGAAAHSTIASAIAFEARWQPVLP